MLFLWPYDEAPQYLREQFPDLLGSWIAVGPKQEDVIFVAESLNLESKVITSKKLDESPWPNSWMAIG